MKIVGLTGAAGAGKDTAAGFALAWCERNGIDAERVAFADPLKVSAARALGFEGTTKECVDFCNTLKGFGEVTVGGGGGSVPEVHHNRISGRRFLQLYGTEAHRDVFGDNFWVEVTERKLAEMAGAVDVVFLTDPRFENEAQMIHKHEGEIWEIVRPGLEKVEAHASEEGLPDGAIEFQLVNAGDLTDLQNLVEAACESNIA